MGELGRAVWGAGAEESRRNGEEVAVSWVLCLLHCF